MSSQFPREDVVWLLGSLSQLHRIPFDPALILQQFPPPYSLVTLIEAARALGFRVGESATPSGAAFAKLQYPCVAFLRAEAARAAPAPEQGAQPSAQAPETTEDGLSLAKDGNDLVLNAGGDDGNLPQGHEAP